MDHRRHIDCTQGNTGYRLKYKRRNSSAPKATSDSDSIAVIVARSGFGIGIRRFRGPEILWEVQTICAASENGEVVRMKLWHTGSVPRRVSLHIETVDLSLHGSRFHTGAVENH